LLHFSCSSDNSTSSKTCYDLNINISGNGSVEYEPDSSCYHEGTEVYITAIPDGCYAFYGWSGNVNFEENLELEEEISITFGSNDINLTADFDIGYTITMQFNTADAGSVIYTPDKDCYPAGATVALEAFANPGYEFYFWEFLEDGSIYESNPQNLTFEENNEFIGVNFITYEGEPDCEDQYLDNYNGGCFSDPPIFQNIGINQIYSGKSGNYQYLQNDTLYYARDTDWYQFITYIDTHFYFGGVADFPLALYILYGPSGCNGPIYFVRADSSFEVGDSVRIAADVPPGNYWMWVGPHEWEGWDCPVEYTVWFSAEALSQSATQDFPEISKEALINKKTAVINK